MHRNTLGPRLPHRYSQRATGLSNALAVVSSIASDSISGFENAELRVGQVENTRIMRARVTKRPGEEFEADESLEDSETAETEQ